MIVWHDTCHIFLLWFLNIGIEGVKKPKKQRNSRKEEKQMRRSKAVVFLAFILFPTVAMGVPINSLTPTLGGPAIDFEGYAEGTLIDTIDGITFGQDDSGRPMIDNSPFLFGYIQSSGVGVLTGSTEGGAQYPTVAGLTISDGLASAVEFHFSDTGPLGDYTIQAFGVGDVLLESFTILNADVQDGQWVGFIRDTADILRVAIDSNVENDAFAIDDVRHVSSIPDASTLFLLGSASLIGFWRSRRKS